MNVKEVDLPTNASSLFSKIPASSEHPLTETSLLEFGLSLGGDFQAERQPVKLVRAEPFNSTKKQTRVVVELPEGGLRAHTKAASEIVLAACNKVINSNGDDEESINNPKATIDQFASEALRTLCIVLETPLIILHTCIGIAGIKDHLRPGVKESVAVCRSTGITVRMATGDNLNTTKAIVRECGILINNGIAVEDPDFHRCTALFTIS
ncbi:hypothetical protein NC653_013914 [Populus alba x Populus x berolinensis]|uniref:Uncharacterized protein n=1 Tax=Populus alba x Populus x berolinensis TaxID=444605 RepID=A0AAD6W446_9ROSI|nr:hypothetical protein NC653_013914 [Populus alba x Populus x berolinensis]